MKEIKLLLAVLIAPLAFQAAADDAVDASRAATRRTPTTVTNTSRQKSGAIPQSQKATGTSRATNIDTTSATTRSRTTTSDTVKRTSSQSTNSERNATVTPRTPVTKIQPRIIKTGSQTPSRTRSATISQSTSPRLGERATGTTRPNVGTRYNQKNVSTARNATVQTTPTAADMLNRDFTKCRDVFYGCMDEFCANKDAQLKRCACSTRINEFNSTKKNLAQIEDKLLDFSQRLLTVNMDKEDAAALNQATEGELAFAAADTSKSKQMLDEIAKKLNTSFNDSNFDQSLNAISLSLNMDAAFDTVDSLAGASTTSKSGTDLYVAALPVCRKMAAEVCTPDDLKIAESGYQVAIEQDCNTVKKSYQTQVDQARTKVFESGALLDMARLDIHQKRNSDDILTCKQKMLDMLTDTTVCGKNLSGCLDTTGRYIDPSTGEAFLTINLSDLGDLITRPDSDQTWSSAPGNDRFVSYLNTKKKYLEPAMENCQDISDYVWESFLDDALAQIKLAQEAKLEQVRQSCTTLTTQCLDKTADSLADFDARALSIFGIAADKTVNAMCSDIRLACTSLLNSTGGGDDWSTGMNEISTEKTYESILQTCREIGRACIIQACTSTSGNFGLCENIDTSINRKSIINRTACWAEVLDCVNSAGDDALAKIMAQHALTQRTYTYTDEETATTKEIVNFNFYDKLYNINDISTGIILSNGQGANGGDCTKTSGTNCVYDLCSDCTNETSETSAVAATASLACYKCRLAERIWGNCEAPANTDIEAKDSHNKIKIPYINGTSDVNGTLLSWFAQNTGTANAIDSCRDTSCGAGFTMTNNGHCYDSNSVSTYGEACTYRFVVYGDKTNCCNTNAYDAWGNCCQDGNKVGEKSATINIDNYYGALPTIKNNQYTNQTICATTNTTLIAAYTENGITKHIICLGSIDTNEIGTKTATFPGGDTITCNGNIIIIDSNAHYYAPTPDTNISAEAVTSYFKDDDSINTYNPNDTTWPDCKNNNDETQKNLKAWSVKYTTRKEVCATAAPNKAPARQPTNGTTTDTTETEQ